MSRFPSISSRENQKLKFARSVREGKEAKYIFVEGIRLTEELLKTTLQIQFVFFNEKLLENGRGLAQLKKLSKKNREIFQVESRIFDSLSDTKTSQGIIVIAEKPQTGKEIIESNLSNNSLLILLHQVNNPANLGAILRTAEAVDVKGIIATKGTVDLFSAKTIRSAMGANFRIPCWMNAEFSDVVNWAKAREIQSVCADIRSQKSYLEIDWKVSKLLIVGSEGHGLSESERLQTDESLIIPMANEVESLNVAVACGIVLFEAKRQREK
jgi:TrmH family RNA methyltransferase